MEIWQVDVVLIFSSDKFLVVSQPYEKIHLPLTYQKSKLVSDPRGAEDLPLCLLIVGRLAGG
jgi:hypothetical protein